MRAIKKQKVGQASVDQPVAQPTKAAKKNQKKAAQRLEQISAIETMINKSSRPHQTLSRAYTVLASLYELQQTSFKVTKKSKNAVTCEVLRSRIALVEHNALQLLDSLCIALEEALDPSHVLNMLPSIKEMIVWTVNLACDVLETCQKAATTLPREQNEEVAELVYRASNALKYRVSLSKFPVLPY